MAGSWTLEELCSVAQAEVERRRIPMPGGRVASSLNARTIRYYTTLGLVDRPAGYDGGLSRYTGRHLLQLLAIKVLQAQYLPLPEIQRRLYGSSDIELQQMIDSLPAAPVGVSAPRWDPWLVSEPVPGLRLVLEDREAFLDWQRGHGEGDLIEHIKQALTGLVPPA